MTTFRTELTITPAVRPLALTSRVMTVGSCFAEVIGKKIQQYKVPALVNPFGTLFNPVSVSKLLEQTLDPDAAFTGLLVEREGYWYAYDLHSSFAAPTQTALRQQLTQVIRQTHAFLKQAEVLIVTLGTAVAYVHKESQQVVANCHKIPQRHFEKRLLSVAEMSATFRRLYQALQPLNPNLRILFTVSPVRHLKETLELNNVSKSALRVLCHELTQELPLVSYFPAYEIMMDDLRDYRFYKADMIHPNEVAEAYIWEKFKTAYFDIEFQQFTQEWDQIQQALHHRPFQPASVAHQAFLRNTLQRLHALPPYLDCAAEIAAVKNQLK